MNVNGEEIDLEKQSGNISYTEIFDMFVSKSSNQTGAGLKVTFTEAEQRTFERNWRGMDIGIVLLYGLRNAIKRKGGDSSVFIFDYKNRTFETHAVS